MLGLILAAVVQCAQHTTPSPVINKSVRQSFMRPAVKGGSRYRTRTAHGLTSNTPPCNRTPNIFAGQCH
jgi:hypothetical protein